MSASTWGIADALIAETLSDPGAVEIGFKNGLRWTLSLTEQPAANGEPGLVLDKDSVFVVTGAAGGITSAIVADLAAHSGGTFYLLDLVGAPTRSDPYVAALRSDREALKLRLIDEAKARGERPTPVAIDKQLMAIERVAAALAAIEAVEPRAARRTTEASISATVPRWPRLSTKCVRDTDASTCSSTPAASRSAAPAGQAT